MNSPLTPFFSRVSVLAILLSVAGCAEQPFDKEPWLASGTEALAPFKMELMGALQAGMQAGPDSAITACRLQAPQIAADAQSAGVELGRTSHKLRNPDNAPRTWAEPLLAAYLADPPKQGPDAVQLEDGRVGYVEPIMVQQLCLTCHGSSLAPEVTELLSAHYPSDEATGFEAGDFRGLFWVEFSPGTDDE